MSLTERFSHAWSALRGKRIRDARELYTATVRVQDEQRQGRYAKPVMKELIARYGKYVKVAASRTATAVASTRLRVFRTVDPGKRRSAWECKALPRVEVLRLRKSAGRFAGKAMNLSDNIEEVTDAEFPLIRLLDQANPFDNGFELLEKTQLNLSLLGNAYWAMVMGPGSRVPDEVWVLPAQDVEIIPDRTNFIAGYRYGRSHEIERVYPPEDIIQFKQWNPHDPWYGMSDLAACLEDADLSVLFTQAAMAMLRNGAQPGVIVTAKNATQAQAREIEESLNRKHGGAWNWFRTRVLTGDVDVHFADVSEGATKFLALPSDKVREVIANCFDMPVSALTQDGSSLASTESQDSRWMKWGIMPRCRRIEDQLNARLVPFYADLIAGRLFVQFDNPVDEDETALYTRLSTAVTADWLTPNDARIEAGFEPVVSENADKLKRDMPQPDPFAFGLGGGGPPNGSGSNQRQDDTEGGGGEPEEDEPVLERDDSGKSGRRGQDNPPGGRGLDAPDGRGRPVKADPPLPGKTDVRQLTDTDLLFGADHGPCCKKPSKAAGDFLKPGDAEDLAAALRKFFAADAARAILKAVEEGRAPDMDGIAVRFDEMTRKAVERIFGQGFAVGADMVNRVRPGAATILSFDVTNQQAVDFFSTYHIRLRESVIRTMTDRLVKAVTSPFDDRPAFVAPQSLNEALQVAIQEGDSLSGAITRMRNEFGEMSGIAAERIARTEMQRGYGAGKVAAWKQVPGITHKRWLLSAQPCAMCRELAATRPVVEIDKPFATVGEVVGGVLITYADVYTNTLHPNDSCGMSMVFEDEA